MGLRSEELHCGESGRKRVGQVFDGNLGNKKIRVSEDIGENFEGLERIAWTSGEADGHLGAPKGASVSQEFDAKSGLVLEDQEMCGNFGVLENGTMGIGEWDFGVEGGNNLSGNGVNCNAEDNDLGHFMAEIDLNFPALAADAGQDEFKDNASPVSTQKKVEVIDVLSDDTESEEVIIVDPREFRGKGKQVEEVNSYNNYEYVNLGLGVMNTEQAVGGSTAAIHEKRYISEGKGEAGVSDLWLLVEAIPVHLDSDLCEMELSENNQPEENVNALRIGAFELGEEQVEAVDVRDEYALWQQSVEARRREGLASSARRLARFQQEDQSEDEQKSPPLEAEEQLGESTGPFSTALRMIRDRSLRKNAPQLIEWKPSRNHENRTFNPLAPSLMDLSLKVLAENAEAIVSLEGVPDRLRRRLTDLLCDSRKMGLHVFDLLVKGYPTEIRVKECSWLTEGQFMRTFENFGVTNLKVFQLDLCGQLPLDCILGRTLCRSPSSLRSLSIISLRGACRLTDSTLQTLVMSAPALMSINLGQCSLVTDAGIKILANSLGSILRELYIDDCQRINMMDALPAFKKFEHLEVLSVAEVESVCDTFITEAITAFGKTIKELDLSGCQKLTNYSLKVIGGKCSDLRSLDISNLPNLTDLGMQFLSDGCQSIQKVKMCRNRFSDEAVAAFLGASGEHLKELSLNNIRKVSSNTALSLSKCSRKLASLDLSWCRQVTSEALGLIIDSCSALRLLKLFGCTQITDELLRGHSNSTVRIIGLKLTPILDSVSMLEPEDVLLRYSPLPFSSDFQSTEPCAF